MNLFVLLLFLPFIYCENSSPLNIFFGYNSDGKTDEHKTQGLNCLSNFNEDLLLVNKQAYFTTNGDVNAGIWMGSRIDTNSFRDIIISALNKEISASSLPIYEYIEYIDENPDLSFGVIFSSEGNKDRINDAVKLWSENTKYNTYINSNDHFNGLVINYLDEANKTPIENDESVGKCNTIVYDNTKTIEEQTTSTEEYILAYNNANSTNEFSNGETICISIGSIDKINWHQEPTDNNYVDIYDCANNLDSTFCIYEKSIDFIIKNATSYKDGIYTTIGKNPSKYADMTTDILHSPSSSQLYLYATNLIGTDQLFKTDAITMYYILESLMIYSEMGEIAKTLYSDENYQKSINDYDDEMKSKIGLGILGEYTLYIQNGNSLDSYDTDLIGEYSNTLNNLMGRYYNVYNNENDLSFEELLTTITNSRDLRTFTFLKYIRDQTNRTC